MCGAVSGASVASKTWWGQPLVSMCPLPLIGKGERICQKLVGTCPHVPHMHRLGAPEQFTLLPASVWVFD